MKRKPSAPAVCPVCGEDVPRSALACPECGADHNSGWREDADTYDGLDLPEESFNYEEFVAQEFGGARKSGGLRTLWWLTALLALIALVMIYFFTIR